MNSKSKRIYLIGFMGCGKSTLAKKIAKELCLSYIDLDFEIEKSTNESISNIINNKGETTFRKIEKDVLKRLSAIDNFVMATGGGTPCFEDNIDSINQSGISVYIKLSPKALYQLLKYSQKNRPLIAGKHGTVLLAYIEETLQQREAYYNKACIVVDGLNADVGEIVKMINIF